MKKTVWEFIKFGIVGTVGLLINLIVTYFFTEVIRIYYMISAIFAFFVALTSNFILNKTWTFKERISHNLASRYVMYFFVNLFSLGINLVFLFILTEFFGIFYLLSQTISIGIAFVFNFLGSKLWTFRM